MLNNYTVAILAQAKIFFRLKLIMRSFEADNAKSHWLINKPFIIDTSDIYTRNITHTPQTFCCCCCVSSTNIQPCKKSCLLCAPKSSNQWNKFI